MTQTVVETPTDDTVATGPKIITPTERTLLTISERCGRTTQVSNGFDPEMNQCGAEAFVKVTYPFDLNALYCAHHATESWPAIIAHAVEIVDERELVNRAASVSANAIAD